eukprot:9504155-Pyramimonas_sp.AAC.2
MVAITDTPYSCTPCRHGGPLHRHAPQLVVVLADGTRPLLVPRPRLAELLRHAALHERVRQGLAGRLPLRERAAEPDALARVRGG